LARSRKSSQNCRKFAPLVQSKLSNTTHRPINSRIGPSHGFWVLSLLRFFLSLSRVHLSWAHCSCVRGSETKGGTKWKRRKKGEGIRCRNRGGADVCGRGEGREEKEKKMGRRSCCPPKERREKIKKKRKEKRNGAFGQNNGAPPFFCFIIIITKDKVKDGISIKANQWPTRGKRIPILFSKPSTLINCNKTPLC
jgi:hypothetical protein